MYKKKLLLVSMLAFALVLTACLGEETPTSPVPGDPSYPPPPAPGGQQPDDPSYPPPMGNQTIGIPYPAPAEDEIVSVADIMANPDAFITVALRGTIREQLEGDKYLFLDSTGQIQLEIDLDVAWNRTLNQTVVVLGEPEMEGDMVQVDVRAIFVV